MRRAESALPLRHAAALGLVQGAAELLPISSSAHTALIPWLAGWRYGELDARARKSFEVALHAGGALAMAVAMRRPAAGSLARLDRRRAGTIALALAPPALAGLALRGSIERRLDGPRSIAAGLAGGALAMALADRADAGGARRLEDAGPLDGLALGLAQALALMPGVSRSGASLTAARARGFSRVDAQRVSAQAGLPLVLGAGALECARLAREGPPAGMLGAMAAGAGASALSSALGARAASDPSWARVPLAPFAAYRLLLAAAVLERARSTGA